ncbi:lasso peptide biosynthesis PqqD family chaperone [Evansella halocellulosilytica]|uniref:lasso peptide biosynthesis PqqD family chaperone n=1 Tax=Evansella halocellulosilytica TaxID=2011013 RepID=UPI000BB8762D|nr:lasso peptide biosynthesis PqqD family chaperone [Evansella halocellulosilytica]
MMIHHETLSLRDTISQIEGNIVSDMDGEKVMLSIHNGKYYNLGEIGGVIWELIDKPITVELVVESLLSEYEVSQNDCEEQVLAFLNHLLKESLINIENEPLERE